jgi:predicted nucleic acid-binding OB-fold protein
VAALAFGLLSFATYPVHADDKAQNTKELKLTVTDKVAKDQQSFVKAWNSTAPPDQRMDIALPKVGDTITMRITPEELESLLAAEKELRELSKELCEPGEPIS